MTTFASFYKTNSIFMRRQLLFIYAFICVLSAWAAPRTQEQAAAIAQEFLAARKSSPVTTRSGSHIRLAATSTDLLDTPSKRSASAQPAFYVYNRGTDAFVIISADDRMATVLGYSEDGAFVTENLPENIKEWLNHYVQAYNRIDHAAEVIPVRQASARAAFATQVSPLLGNIQYNQDAPYNNQCPLYAGMRCVTGCVATAAAQIMRYWKYPTVGKGVTSYSTYTLDISCYYNYSRHSFDWNNILPTYTGEESSTEINAIANLMLACGMACEMDYAPWTSGASSFNMLIGLIEHLDYDKNMYWASRETYTSDEWMNLIKTELNAKRPIYYSGSSTGGGHAFVVDGYDREDHVHVNWGWGGSCNGYFEVLTLDATGSGIGGYDDSSYQFNQSMIVGLQPKSSATTYTSHFSIDRLDFSSILFHTGETFYANGYGIYNYAYDFDGSFALIAEKDGVKHILSQYAQDFKPRYGWNNLNLEATIPASFEDGVYSVYIATRDFNETTWNKAYGDLMDACYYTLYKSEDLCLLFPDKFDKSQLAGSCTLTHNLYQDMGADIEIAVRNESDTQDFFGQLGVLFIDESGDIAQDMLNKQVLLKAGEEIRFTLNNNINLKPGTYTMRLTAGTTSYYLYLDEGQEVVVEEKIEDIPILVAQNVSLDTDRLYNGDTMTVRATLSLIGEGLYNGAWLEHYYAPIGGDESTKWIDFTVPYLEMGSTTDYVYKFPIEGNPGIYTYTLYSTCEATYITRALYTTTFTVLEGSGVEDAESDRNKPVVWYVQGEDNLHVRTEAEIEDITIYGMDGQAVSRTHPETAGNGEYLVPTGNTDKGGYIMVLREKGGKRHMIKFIR